MVASGRRCRVVMSVLIVATLLTLVNGLHQHLMDDKAFDALDEDTKEEMSKRELENCVPHDIRSFVIGSRGVIEWSTRRTYIRKVHKTKKHGDDDEVDPWQACSDDADVEARFREVGSFATFERKTAISHYQLGDNVTSHKAWIRLTNSSAEYEFMVGSTFHGWSNVQRLGDNLLLTSDEELYCRPKHVHTAYGKTPGSFSVQWMTMGECTHGVQQLKLLEGHRALISESTPVTADAKTTLFVDDGSKKIARWMHVVELKGLKTNTRYTYAVGSDKYSWSVPFSTKTAPSREESKTVLPMRFLITGDIGYQNAATLPMMQSEVAEGAVDAIVSMGDYAYDLHLANGRVGDIFMEEIEPISASVPFMVAPGNHETHNVFSHYSERFRNMPSNTGTVRTGHGEAPNNWFYSFDVGLVHFVVISTEIYFKKTFETDIVERQENWLREDLARANANRVETPWIIVVGHRPMYCTSDKVNCVNKAAKLRDRLEDLFYMSGVDLYICGHQHNYERAFDIYRSETWRRTTNMRATTHILTGASGQYQLSIMRKEFELPPADWDAFRNSIFGYSRLQVFNETHIRWQQVESDPENPVAHGMYGKVADDVWFIQENHGAFGGAPEL
ncbi:hypothetical protein Poli38472_006213 [Pythium oligandrum]|uniref:Purple acid phosphatase n=1 Tax=Pythium oligandrum TaxID=41045 RepID=A0A8K1FLX9_PYTOL|nr:hypothetical protein Poli38472_006213 [Pythium oligandrum]|eukprot:TMW68745.1 hypothetical protein Poli38472_006213 [Pythium oligandrum]